MGLYCVYELDPIDFSRNNEFTTQNALFGAIEITKNANTSKYEYKGYGISFDKSEEFTHVRKEGNVNHWIALYVKNVKVVYFDSFGVEHVLKEIIKFIKNTDIPANIYLDYKHMIQLCVVIFVLNLLIICLMTNL